ncbi:hypothetical protein PSU4_25440 [Pseudonocardia sulfidoxydans NBRC 16205]|uniref:Uncharacterized protein n=1 Tax=Pseudonocardia sulfidoxydans NBRC 16205 TaxID=1223511 RepID=A0A511DFM2_9PSEU|nr:hypothetical protein [Pseudonocardia sulfidoxydans]GEL23590.1 hypothetical protein PSU4_25440 [Pseudonocardia sulfidoxydans NBRC 16205]
MTARTATLAVRAAGVVLALVVWSITHTVTHLAIVHPDAGGTVLPGTFAARLALGAAALTLVAFVAAAVAGRPGAGIPTRGASLAAPVAFVGAEFVTHIGTELAAARLALIGVALGVNALVGAAYQQLWSVGLGSTDRILALLAGVPVPSTPTGPAHTAFHRTFAAAGRTGRVTTRGPPRPPCAPSPFPTTRLLPLPA